jgi:hypothetical protein
MGRLENPCVGGSIPPQATRSRTRANENLRGFFLFARVITWQPQLIVGSGLFHRIDVSSYKFVGSNSLICQGVNRIEAGRHS